MSRLDEIVHGDMADRPGRDGSGPVSLTCKHCHKPIRSANFYDGPGWTHEDSMIGRWCRINTATPDDAQCVWDDSVAPGGFVCGVCRLPVESEPCREHQPGSFAESQR